MTKQAISITLEADNITWLKGRAGASGLRSVSELLDQLVTAARDSGGVGQATSVVGTIDIDPGDPLLEGADEAIGALFDASLSRPLTIHASVAPHKIRRPAKRHRG